MLLALLAPAGGAGAQREFVEEVEPKKQVDLDDVDLDAPDVGAKPTDPKKKPPDPAKPADPPKPGEPTKPGEPAKPVDGKPGEPAKPGDPGKPAEPAKPADGLPAVPPPPPPSELGQVRVLETSYAALLEKWDVRAGSARKGEQARARAQLVEVREALKDFGVQGVPGAFHASGVATALVRESRRALDDGGLDDAMALVEAAEAADADLPLVPTMSARIKWSTGDIGGTVNALLAAAKLHRHDPLALSQLGARALAVVWLAAFAALALLALCVGLPALRYASFDVVLALPKGAAQGQIWLLLAMLGFAPLVVGGGPLLGALWLVTLAWLHLPGRARGVALVLGAVMVTTPFALDFASRLYGYAGSRADLAHRALYDVSGEPERARLRARPADALDLWEQAALAYQAKREGRLDEAATRLAALLERHPEASFARAELGVVRAVQGDHEGAVVELGKAASADARLVAATFNTSVLQFRLGNTDKAEAAVRALPESARPVIEAFRVATFRAPDAVIAQNRAFVDVYPPPLDALRAGLADEELGRELEAELARGLTFGQTGERALVVCGAFPLVWLVLLALRKRLAPAQACVRCGSPASSRIDDKDVPADICGQCFHAFVSTRSRIDAAVKLRKERQIMLRGRRRSRTVRVLSLVCPGAGHLVAGAAARGALLSFLWAACGVTACFVVGLVPMPRLDGPWGTTPGLVVVGAVAGVVWLTAQWSAWGLADDLSVRGRGR